MTRRDLAPIIARVLVEHPPAPMGTSGYLHWAHSTWPDCSDAEVLRALLIADELMLLDRLAQ